MMHIEEGIESVSRSAIVHPRAKEEKLTVKQSKLGQFRATAISGNDISSSVLYVSSLSIIYAGQFAWITLLIVAFILFLFRKIYGEVVGALPLNGGAYNALLNTTSKNTASFAATLTILSYMATSVISGNEAMHYLHSIIPEINVINATILLLAFFAGLTILGITESSVVALIIFIFHLSSMLVLLGSIGYYLALHGLDLFYQNCQYPMVGGSFWTAVFFGFSASMLGISGFESSANFVEEQKRGVFPKTLRNMWVIVSILNPLMTFFALSIIPISEVKSLYQNTLLSHMAEISSGSWLSSIVSIDAVLVLSGAVLTSFVGVSGLLERMTLDRILPPFFLKKNRRGTSHRIFLLFFILNILVLSITHGTVTILAGVYTISFLSVMGLFAIGNIFLKLRREKLPRPEKAGWISVLLALIGVLVALIGNIRMEEEGSNLPSNFTVFVDFFVPTITIVVIMLNRVALLKALINIVHYLYGPLVKSLRKTDRKILDIIDRINSQEFVFFTKGDNIVNLNKVILYIMRNEQTKRVKIVTVVDEGAECAPHLKDDVEFLKRAYPNLKIDLVQENGNFGPQLIKDLSEKWGILPNFMFIGSPGDNFPYHIEDLYGVRLII